MNNLNYKNNLDETLDRLRLLYEHRLQDRIFASFEIPSTVLKEYNQKNPEGYCESPDLHERIAFWEGLLQERMAVEDDFMPSAYLSEFDQGLYGGLVGGDVQFMYHDNGWISSMVSPILADWSEFDSLVLEESHPWFQRFVRQMQVFTENASDKFGISHFILIDGLNFSFELVGATETYESIIECPENVTRAIEFAFDLNLKVQQTFFEYVSTFRGGTFSNMVQWIPGKVISESVDPFHMTSVDYFETWGRANIERMFSCFDGGVLHIHGNGRHLLEAVSSITGLKAVFLGDDTGFPPAFDVLDELKLRMGDIPLVVMVDFAEFSEKLHRHELPGGVFYLVLKTPDADTANRCMEKVRSYIV